MTTLISTFYSFVPLVAAVHAFSPRKIILVAASDSLKKEDVKKELAKAKEVFGNVARIEVLEVDGGDLVSIAKKTRDTLEKEKGDVIVNVSGGWKLLAQGVIYGCYARPELVRKVVCNNLEDNSIVELPKLSYGLSAVKKELLAEMAKRNGRTIAEIAKKLGKTRGMVYQHLKELKDAGYVDEKFEVTTAGRLGLL